jgi:hypothetical protein
MSEQPKIKLSRLRQIGWSLWDPIGLSEIEGDEWKDGGPCADEYDSYLLCVAGMLRQGKPRTEAVAYLEEIEIDRMGLNPVATTRQRAEATVAAIADYVATLGPGRLQVR